MRRILAVLLAMLPAASPARSQTLLAAIHAGQWPQAEALAAAEPDPLAQKLVRYYRLLTPGAARAADIAGFMADNPDWPQQALLSRRLQEALAVDHDDRTVLEICRQRPPQSVPSLLRCADAVTPGDPPAAAVLARRAWLTGITDPAAEAAFMHRWAPQITQDDQWRRFDHLAWSDPGGAAARQAVRLLPPQRAAAEARLALRHDAPTGPAIAAALAGPFRTDPGLVLELARWYRRAGQDRDAAAIWTGAGIAAEQAAPLEHRAEFWNERNQLARRLLRAADPARAYAVAEHPAANPESALDQQFLAGWIALRRIDRADAALTHFATLAGLSPAALTQSRAHYWLGRAQFASGNTGAATAEFTTAAQWPTTFYGQLAALALGNDAAALSARIAAAQDPGWSSERALGFLAQDGARAAVLLAAWGEPRRAKAFIQRLDEQATDPTARALAARLALGLGLPEQAVAIARRAGRDGVMLPDTGWPNAATPPPGPVEASVVLGLIRQESSFDIEATSPVGARGLMQLMPATAAAVARKLGLATSVPALTADAGYNMRLGTSYLDGLLTQFGQALPLAIAGYNAGPGRVQDWLIANDPGAGADMIDWIELIPFNETRNYVQRVIENIVIYRARSGATSPHPTDIRRG